MSDIVIYGRGKTGQNLREMLKKQGKQAVFYDDELGFDDGGCFTDDSLVLLSPGVKPNSKGLSEAKKCGAKIISELEYCFRYCSGKFVSVTGTNGKTTTCEMISHILQQANVAYHLLGNGGKPLSSEALDVNCDEIVVLESSSFQLINAHTFAPYISIFTSLACDHLDYHGSFDNYVTAKLNNFLNQCEGYAIFNADDDNVVELSNLCNCKKLYYSTDKTYANCYFDKGDVVVNVDGKQIRADGAVLCGYAKHNLSNALSAVLSAHLLGIPLRIAVDSFADYKLLPHRMEVVATAYGVTFVDDSKATNVHATVNALQNYRQPLALILGGSDKGEKFDDIFETLSNNVVAVTASGDTSEQIAACGKTHGVSVKVFDDIGNATKYCFDVLKNCGGVVLMSNACASFDKFSGYDERGEYFHHVVKGLIGDKKAN